MYWYIVITGSLDYHLYHDAINIVRARTKKEAISKTKRAYKKNTGYTWGIYNTIIDVIVCEEEPLLLG